MNRTFTGRIMILLSAVMLSAALSACGGNDVSAGTAEVDAPVQAAEPAELPAPTQQAQPDDMPPPDQEAAEQERAPAPAGEYTATKMISHGEITDIEPMHLTVNEDGSGLMSDNNGSYNVTFYFDEGAGIIHELQSYFTFQQEGDSLVLTDGRGAETVFERDE